MEKGKNILEINNINVSYGSVEVIHDLSLSVKKGEIVVLLGPNGAGKTTTLKSVIGLLPLKSGEIYLKGLKINNLKTHEIVGKGVGIVPEGRGIFPKLSVHENLVTGAIFRNFDLDSISKKIDEAFERFPILKQRKNQIAGTLSGGEQTMLALSRAMMSNPELLLMDEPSLGLAPNLIDKIFELIQEFNNQGVSILLIEQNAAHAIEICDKGYILQKGRIVIEGERKVLLSDDKVRKSYFATV